MSQLSSFWCFGESNFDSWPMLNSSWLPHLSMIWDTQVVCSFQGKTTWLKKLWITIFPLGITIHKPLLDRSAVMPLRLGIRRHGSSAAEDRQGWNDHCLLGSWRWLRRIAPGPGLRAASGRPPGLPNKRETHMMTHMIHMIHQSWRVMDFLFFLGPMNLAKVIFFCGWVATSHAFFVEANFLIAITMWPHPLSQRCVPGWAASSHIWHMVISWSSALQQQLLTISLSLSPPPSLSLSVSLSLCLCLSVSLSSLSLSHLSLSLISLSLSSLSHLSLISLSSLSHLISLSSLSHLISLSLSLSSLSLSRL